MYGYFKRQTTKISYKKTWTWLQKENLKWETESLLIAAENNDLKTNYIEEKIDNARQKSKNMLYADKNETINHRKSDNSKLVRKEYKRRHDRVEKVNH